MSPISDDMAIDEKKMENVAGESVLEKAAVEEPTKGDGKVMAGEEGKNIELKAGIEG